MKKNTVTLDIKEYLELYNEHKDLTNSIINSNENNFVVIDNFSTKIIKIVNSNETIEILQNKIKELKEEIRICNENYDILEKENKELILENKELIKLNDNISSFFDHEYDNQKKMNIFGFIKWKRNHNNNLY